MVITTGSAAARITPVVVKTFFSHYYKRARRSSKDRNVQATDELIYDEAFHIVQKFCELATHDTVESIQNFTNTQIPTPPWALSIPVLIPLSSCHQAADALIKYFGPEELETIVGGEKWWQVRPQNGVPAEWIAQRDDWAMYEQEKHKHQPSVNSDGEHVFEDDDADSQQSSRKKGSSRRPTKQQKRHQRLKATIEEQDGTEDISRLKRVMLYIHGGAYYWGSINTHRHQIIRFARKFGGRALAVNYRKAPDYPWPAPLHDCLAAYMYLIRPPPGAPHPPIDPKKLVIAGDSAGGGLCLALLGVLRDTGIPMPAGAVLISPWCDMTHSFPSILQNTATDIVPPYGFIHKPSPLWPIPATVPEDRNRQEAEPGDGKKKPELSAPQGVDSGHNTDDSTGEAAVSQVDGKGPSEGARKSDQLAPPKESTLKKQGSRIFGSLRGRKVRKGPVAEEEEHVPIPPAPKWLYSPPIQVPVSEEAIKMASEGKGNDPSGKVDFTGEVELQERSEDGKRVGTFELKRQIQQYAANKQVFHPLCSPVMQGSLGGFPPLYILAGDAEVLRDEIIYLAHRAAHPKKYPLGEHLMTPRAREAAEKYDDIPTKVHFQLYDDQCHVLTVFAFTTQAKYAFRAIASFVKHVTGAKTSVLDMPFPRVLDGDVVQSPGERAEQESLATLDSNNPPSDIGREPDAADAESETATTADASEEIQASTDLAALPEDAPLDSSQYNSNGAGKGSGILTSSGNGQEKSKPALSVVIADDKDVASDKRQYPGMPFTTSAEEMRKGESIKTPISALSPRQQRLKEEKERKHTLRERKQKLMSISQPNEYDGQVPLMRPQYREFMIRERVDIRGQIRGMEKESQMQALQLTPDEIGVIKEGPCLRYMAGQKIWDRKFKRTVKKVERARIDNEHKAAEILRKAYKQGLLGEAFASKQGEAGGKLSEWEEWLANTGPTTIIKETPPPSAIVGRRDTAEAIQLLLLCLRARAKALDVHNAHLSGRPARTHRHSHSRSFRGKPHRRSTSHGTLTSNAIAGSSSAGASQGSQVPGADAGADESGSGSDTEEEGPRAVREGGKAHGLTAWNTLMSSLYRARTTPKERREVKLKQRKSPAPSRPTSVAYEDQADDDDDDEDDEDEEEENDGQERPATEASGVSQTNAAASTST
ncbi:hypothetical protein OC842_000466 [Tilletia horrida]|uniref:Alpha/beta hydrolase fold-3 domain-containing protein n=1 Tax=Tilletia horrida TaxID=155126 RepID=A0AAN6GLQ9_9BASI|nr:hypothetical protein OC842_000466 [Tilletia horrida]KAK0556273.1 hypothetical protein OC844_005892 [Tilletia horrida]